MVRNYLKTALRFLKYNKVFAGINIMGLSIALAASFIILLYVINELSYESCHKNRKNVYRVLNYYKEFKQIMAGTPYVLASTLKDEYPQVKKACTVRPVSLIFKIKEKSVAVRPAMAASPDIFDIFTIPLIEGAPGQDLLEEKNSVVLSRELAERFFPGENPVGKEMAGIINNKENLFIVKGVFEDIQVNSILKAQCFISSWWTLAPINETFKVSNADVNWTFDFWNTWILLTDGTDPDEFEKQFRAFEKKNISENPTVEYSLQNLSDVYLDSENVANTGLKGNIKNVRLFSLIAFLIVLVAAMNYIILATAVSSSRGREIGIRKTFGAYNNNIKKQLLSESILLVLLVLPVALVLAGIALPAAGKLFQKDLYIIPSNIWIYVMVYLGVTILIGFFSGLYTSSYLSRLEVLNILKNPVQTGKKRQLVRSALMILQLVIFCTFISSTLIIRSQYNYALNKDTGHYTKDILMVELGRNFRGYSSFINSIKSNPNIIMAAGVMTGLPMQGSMSTMQSNFQNPETKIKVEGLAVDYNFLKTMGIPVIKGREFSEEFGSDLTQSVILNETAVKALGISDPIGQKLGESNIIGVVKDFNLHSIHTDIPPLSIHMTDKYIQQVAVHYRPGMMNAVLTFIEAEWKKAAPDRPFMYSTIESLIASLYSSEKNLSTIVSIFALFTLLIAAFGLFGLVLFVSKSRTKEIGIKKVFGSSGKSIIRSFLKSNLILVLISSLISIPVTIYFMSRWLNNFSFRTSISPWVFIISFVISALVVTATVFFHSYKASRTNPVEALRYE
ncbi:MAG TPA: ABC transporter permease [Bacteroidales bacterium]|nr:ABC transporter permease [Bacteroidales bacterium]